MGRLLKFIYTVCKVNCIFVLLAGAHLHIKLLCIIIKSKNISLYYSYIATYVYVNAETSFKCLVTKSLNSGVLLMFNSKLFQNGVHGFCYHQSLIQWHCITFSFSLHQTLPYCLRFVTTAYIDYNTINKPH